MAKHSESGDVDRSESGPTAAADVLAVSSWSWHAAYYAGNWSLLDQPAAAAAAGLAAIECNDFMLPPPRFSRIRRPLLALLPGAPPELWRYSRATLRQLAANARAHGCRVIAWTINSDFAVQAHHWPAQRFYLRRGLAAARLLQAPLLRVNLGGTAETARRRDAVIVRRLVAFVAASHRDAPGTAVTVENHWGVSTDIDRHLELVDRVAARLQPAQRKLFGCCFDPGNMPAGPDRARWWRALAARANHYHLKTTTVTPAGGGSLPLEALFALLDESGYRGAVTIEFAGDGVAAAGVAAGAGLYHAHHRRPG